MQKAFSPGLGGVGCCGQWLSKKVIKGNSLTLQLGALWQPEAVNNSWDKQLAGQKA